MFSNRLYSIVALVIPQFTALGICVYTWDSTKQLFAKPKGLLLTINQILVTVLQTTTVLWLVYTAIQLIKFFLLRDHDSFVFAMTGLLGLIVVSEFFSITLWRAAEWYQVLNSVVKFSRHLHQSFMPQYKPDASKFVKFVDFIIILLFFNYVFLSIITAALILKFYDCAWLPGNFVPNTWYFLPVNIFLPIYITTVLYITICNIIQFVLLYGLILLPFILNEFTLGRKSYVTVPELRKVTTLTTAYRAVQMLQLQVINGFAGIYLVPSQAVVTTVFVFCNLILIYDRNRLSGATTVLLVVWAYITPLFWTAVLMVGGYLHSKGNKLLKSWKHHNWQSGFDRKLMKKFRVSCPPLMLSYGKAYVLRKSSLIIFKKDLVRGLMRALLMLGKK